MAKGRSDEHYLLWQTISVDGREAAFGVAGEGPPLVFLHGWALGRVSWIFGGRSDTSFV